MILSGLIKIGTVESFRLERTGRMNKLAVTLLAGIHLLGILIGNTEISVEKSHISNDRPQVIVGTVSGVFAAEEYLSQEYIDTMVQRAYMLFQGVETARDPDKYQRHAVERATKIAKELRARASGDRNEKYAAWKVGELEGHIQLEEKEILLRKIQNQELQKGPLIAAFNQELARECPEFSKLKQIHLKTSSIDPNVAAQMSSSIRQKSRVVTRDVSIDFEKCIMGGDLDGAEGVFEYCDQNRMHLRLDPQTYSFMESRIGRESRIRDSESAINDLTRKIHVLLGENRLTSAWHELTAFGRQMESIGEAIPASSRRENERVLEKLLQTAEQKEDSILAFHAKVLEKRGVDAAIAYVEHLNQTGGLSQRGYARADSMILAARGQSDDVAENAVARELSDLASFSGTQFALEDAHKKAEAKLKARADSIRAVEEERLRKRHKELARARAKQEREERRAARRLRRKRKKAEWYAVRLYKWLERGRIKRALRKYSRIRGKIEEYLDENRFAMLETAIRSAREDLERPEKTPTMIAVPQKRKKTDLAELERRAEKHIEQIYALLEQEEVGGAMQRFKNNYELLRVHLYGEAFHMLQSTLEAAAGGTVEEAVEETVLPTETAEMEIVKIYELLGKEKVKEAWRSFHERRDFLKKYTAADAFTVLEETLSQARQLVKR